MLQDLFLLSYENDTIDDNIAPPWRGYDDNEFSVLHEEFMPKNSNFSYGEYDRFSLEEMNVMNVAEFPARCNLKQPSRYRKFILRKPTHRQEPGENEVQ